MLNYIEHTYGVRGEFEAAYAIFHDVDSTRLDEFSEMNDNSYCLSRPFTRLVKKKYHFASSKILKYTFSTPFSTPYHHPQHRSPST